MKYCPHCGTAVEDAVKFCFRCGYPFPVAPAHVPEAEPASQTECDPAPAGEASDSAPVNAEDVTAEACALAGEAASRADTAAEESAFAAEEPTPAVEAPVYAPAPAYTPAPTARQLPQQPQKRKDLLTTVQYILLLLLFQVPVIGFVFMFVFGCGNWKNTSLKRFSLAVLILTLIALILTVSAMIVLYIVFVDDMPAILDRLQQALPMLDIGILG